MRILIFDSINEKIKSQSKVLQLKNLGYSYHALSTDSLQIVCVLWGRNVRSAK